MMLAGVLDIQSSEKAARFVRTCDAFNIPLITFVDVPGPSGVDQSTAASSDGANSSTPTARPPCRACRSSPARPTAAPTSSWIPRVGCDISLAWPSAEIAVMGPQSAVEIVYRRELADAADPEARRAELVEDYTQRLANPYLAAGQGYVDDVIEPSQTRRKLIAGMRLLESKRERSRSASTGTSRCSHGTRHRPAADRRGDGRHLGGLRGPVASPVSGHRARVAVSLAFRRPALDEPRRIRRLALSRSCRLVNPRPEGRVSESGCGYRPTRYRPTTCRPGWPPGSRRSRRPTGRSRGTSRCPASCGCCAGHRRRPRR